MWGLFARAPAGSIPRWASSMPGQSSIWETLGRSFEGARGYKVVTALRRRCRSCRIVQRGKKTYVLCLENPRHKQRNGKGGSRYSKS